MYYVTGVFLILAATEQVYSAGPVCYNCNSIPHPRDCGRIVQCGEHEKCNVENFVTSSGGVFFNSGCTSKTRCDASGKRSLVTNDIYDVMDDDIPICFRCCDNTNYCNRDLCDTSPGPTRNATTCLHCSDVEHPEDCEYVTLCNEGEVCYTEKIFLNGEMRFRMGCIRRGACASPQLVTVNVGKRWLVNADHDPNEYCNMCCNSAVGNCNRELCNTLPLSPGTTKYILKDPPQRTDLCTDLTPQSCKLLGLQNTSFCLDSGVKNFACREFCGTCVNPAHLTPAPTAVDKSDCYFDSQQYEGHVSTTINNRQCRLWSDFLTPGNPVTSNLPDNSLADASNFCRDPDGKGYPWCYVSLTSLHLGWEFCSVRYCQECYYHGNSAAYNGHFSTPTPATMCQSWVNIPNSIQLLQDTQFPEGSIGKARNYCRDPLRMGTLYCYVNDVRTGCNIPECTGACADDPNTNCAVIAASIGLCRDLYFSTILCAKTCGRCGFGLLPAVQKSPPAHLCSDNPDANCALLKSLICSDPDAGRTLCPKTCNMCGSLFLTTPAGSHVTTSVSTTSSSLAVWFPWGQYKCISVNSTCLQFRLRSCSTGHTADCQGKHSSIIACTKHACPDYFTTGAPTISTTSAAGPDSCRDDPTFNCNQPSLPTLICPEPTLVIYCRKTCNRCAEHCKDMVGVNCASPAVQQKLCPHDHYSRQFCRKTCGKCDLPPLNITTNTCNDPVATDAMCPFLNQEVCICDDIDLRPVLCPHYCAGECGAVGHFMCPNSVPTPAGRRKRLADLMGQLNLPND